MGHPTTEPAAERVLQNLEAALGAISTNDATTSYWNDVRYVVRHDAGYPTLQGYPAIVVMIQNKEIRDDLSFQTHSLNSETLSLRLDAWIEASSDVARAMQRMERDVRTAIMLDPQRGGLAVHTYVEGANYAYSPETSESHALVELDISILYRTRVDQLETTV